MTPELVSPERLHEVWPYVRKGCEKVISKTGGEFIPEDVYTAIQTQQAYLFLIGDLGFVVVQRLPGHSGPSLFVWVIYGKFAGVEDQLYAWLKNMARDGGMKKVWWRSPRKWNCRPGVKLAEFVYELE